MIHEVVINQHQITVLLRDVKLSNSLKTMIQRHMNRSVTKTAVKQFICRGRTHTTQSPQKHWYVSDILEAIDIIRVSKNPSLWRTKDTFIVKQLQDFERRTQEKLEKDK